MKRLFILSIGILIQALPLSSQSLVLPERIWSNTNYAVVPGAPYNSNWIKFEGDTLIDDTIYMKVYRSEDEFQDSWDPHGAIREDDAEKVYRHMDDTKYLLYDFNLEKGDSILTSPEGYAYVADVYTIYLENFGDSLKRIDFSFLKDGGAVEAYWIEGIGSSHGILQGARQVGLIGAGWAMVCFSESGNLLYQNEAYDECFPRGYLHNNEGINAEGNDMEVRIGPTSICFNFSEIPQRKSTLAIFDISGRLIWQEGTRGTKQITIQRSLFKSGIFLYSFRGSDSCISGKFAL
jgi:hypothetical protein